MIEKHIFAGNNTSSGFYSCFNNVFNPYELNHFYILKGGPGVGKSSFMKKFAKEMEKKSLSLEYIHCSSDNDSLDGIVIPELKIALVDGTAPHTIDPVVPGAVDEIINLGEYIDKHNIEKHKKQIIQINQTKSRLYKSVYRYLQSAGNISDELNSLYDQFLNIDKFNQFVNDAANKLIDGYPYLFNKATSKKMFSEAYTSTGYISHTSSLCQNRRIWTVISESTNYTSNFIEKLADKAAERGYNTEIFLRPLTPDKYQHICIPEMNLMIISSESYASSNGSEEVFDLHSIMDTDNMKSHISEIENNLHIYEELIKNALNKLAETKKYHELLEVFYVNSMDFDGVNNCFDNLLRKYT